MRRLRFIVALLALESIVPAGSRAAETESIPQWTPEQIAFFETKIRPVLVEHCYKCHSSSAEHVKGGLMLDSREGMRQGGDSGRAIVPGQSDESLLIEALRYESYEMPPSGRLSEKIIADFVKWVEMGAPDPRDATRSDGPTAADGPTSETDSPQEIDWDAARKFWAFEQPRKHTARHAQHAWVQRPIDGFILDRLVDERLTPSPPADRRTLIRRVTFDLIGLPPTPEEVETFLADESPTAYESLVDRLLASPHYGERWAQLWLDIMRYAEDQAHIVGNDTSLFYPNAYLYRDWVIAALNDDLPYDEFIRLQLAADLTHPDDAALHIATGFIGLGPKYYRRRAPEVQVEEWENQVDTLTRGLLGLTVACARCHDHKYDPIPTEDYYAIAGVFAGTELFNRPLSSDAETDKNAEAKKPEDAAHIVRDTGPRDVNVMIRGDVTNTGPLVPRRFLRILCKGEPSAFTHGDSGRRELADAIASPDNPLTARVIVNRIWGAHFGRHLVGTPSNFGFLGERPTHPELLDDLAVRFMEHGWSLKWLHREIVLSATYHQASIGQSCQTCSLPDRADAEVEADLRRPETIDPANTLLWRMNRKRLNVEQWRDAILAVSGRLVHHVGGRSLIPSDPEARRRTVYAARSRYDLNRMLALFDFPDANIHAARRAQTTTPLQKMFVLNSPFMAAQAAALAERVRAEEPDSVEKRIDRLYKLLYSRPPSDRELRVGREFLADADAARLVEYAHVLLAANEMLVID